MTMLNNPLTRRPTAWDNRELSMRLWSILLAGTVLMLGLSAPALADGSASQTGSRTVSTGRFAQPDFRSGNTFARHGGPARAGRWHAGWRAPGGWAAYRRPVVGYILPSYWMSPAYRIPGYHAYALPTPPSGYGWSRYYDDAVMIDRNGRVGDYRDGLDWEHPRQDAPPPGIGYDDEVTAPDAPPPYAYEGRWNGVWRDKDGRTHSGEYEGRFEGQVERAPGVDYDAPPYAVSPQEPLRPARPGDPVVTTTQAPGYFAGGYYYPGVTTTTVVVQPAVTRTSTYVTERVVRRKPVRSCRCK